MPDAMGGWGAERRSVVLKAVANAWSDEQNRSECNLFVASVVANATNGKIVFPVDANANAICGLIQAKPWSVIGKGADSAMIAGVLAAHEGKLVVAAWRNPHPKEHGHCAIVLDFTTSKKPPSPDAARHIGALMKNRAVIAQGKHHHPEQASEYMKASLGFGSATLKGTVFSYVDIG